MEAEIRYCTLLKLISLEICVPSAIVSLFSMSFALVSSDYDLGTALENVSKLGFNFILFSADSPVCSEASSGDTGLKFPPGVSTVGSLIYRVLLL